ncbi:E3 ubiquitin-protein ligase UPL7 isoform X3 [Carica papaya]|uniref:E3 ubiquitin-protein ligase UPL7 isoform X3 n=1 Tax=Carica papaya TaxID=3649 RepID=UPI000B8CC6AC|nr:E3 ubiquitin-protein ligase UPL7 isoform X3 [Carica papaya]
MDQPRKHQVSLRGASAKEISRDALLEKVSHERELRSYARRANAAVLFIQRVWRRHSMTKKTALQLKEVWENSLSNHADLMTRDWVSSRLLRPFLFFISCLSVRNRNIQNGDVKCMQDCFKILLESMNSTDSRRNFCSLAVGTLEERRTWTYQAQKLISLCFFILAECAASHGRSQDFFVLTSLALRLVVILTDLKGWRSITENNFQDADVAVKNLVQFLGTRRSGLFVATRKYINKLNVPFSSKINSVNQTDYTFLITTTAITLALRPFHMKYVNSTGTFELDICHASEQYWSHVLTIPWLTQRVPPALLPALKHNSVLSSCFQILLISRDKILMEISDMDRLGNQCSSMVIPPVGWALANIICLVTGSESDSSGFNQDLDCASYVHVVITLAENFLPWIDNVGCKDHCNFDISAEPTGTIFHEDETICKSLKMSYMDLLRPVCQQWHLAKLLATSREVASAHGDKTLSTNNPNYLWKLELLDITYFYSQMLRIFKELNPAAGQLPILNMLAFTPGYLVSIWGVLESSLFPGNGHYAEDTCRGKGKVSGDSKDGFSEKKQKDASKDGVNKWVNVLHKFTGKSQAGSGHIDLVEGQPGTSEVSEDSSDVWDIETLRRGPQGISKEMSYLLHLFCATYSHLLLVLDDIEFYEKQVPFVLEQQRRIASMLNTLVYNGLSHSLDQENKPLMDYAIRCLHLMYERDCRHPFCPPLLWLSPGRRSRPSIALAARAHEFLSANMRTNDTLHVPSIGSVITTTQHVFPFEERVQMFREFVNMDKATRKMAGEVTGPGSRLIEIVVRRGHVVEDGFRQLNSLGARLKSSIHVSFVSECGLPEAGLDYGGLSKEFLTDISKAAFAPEYGLFSQTSTSDRLLIPNSAARHLENGIQMIEFLGRVVGKALYEGILLDYSFSHVFVQKLLGRYSFLDELSTLDPELYRNLMYVKHYDGDVKDLSLDFTVTEESFGKRHVIELKPGGKDISVTNENKMQYIHAMADYKLNRQILPFSNAFYRGLTDLIFPSWLKLFNASEFNQLLSGGNHDIDVEDLRNNTRYTGGYSAGSRTIRLFWEVIKGFEPKERCMLLKFVTSCSRAPLLGFKYLQPTFTIHKVLPLLFGCMRCPSLGCNWRTGCGAASVCFYLLQYSEASDIQTSEHIKRETSLRNQFECRI